MRNMHVPGTLLNTLLLEYRLTGTDGYAFIVANWVHEANALLPTVVTEEGIVTDASFVQL